MIVERVVNLNFFQSADAHTHDDDECYKIYPRVSMKRNRLISGNFINAVLCVELYHAREKLYNKSAKNQSSFLTILLLIFIFLIIWMKVKFLLTRPMKDENRQFKNSQRNLQSHSIIKSNSHRKMMQIYSLINFVMLTQWSPWENSKKKEEKLSLSHSSNNNNNNNNDLHRTVIIIADSQSEFSLSW